MQLLFLHSQPPISDKQGYEAAILAAMNNESPLASPEDVACYEECVTDDTFRSSSPTVSSKDIPKSSSGKVAKRGKVAAMSLGTLRALQRARAQGS